MKLSKYKLKQKDLLSERAVDLRKQGYSLRDIGEVIGVSYEWVRRHLKEKMGDDYM